MNLWQKTHAYHRFWRYRRRTERPEIAFIRSLDLAGGTLVDVGANRGAYTYWLHRCVKHDGQVIAFEPQPELVEYLGALKKSFGLNRLTVVHSALSDSPGRLPLVRPRKHWGAASFHLEANAADCDVIDVPVMTLDDYFEQHELPPVRFIKCDVQDHEAFVFRGGRRVIERHRPTLLFEQTEECVRNGESAAVLQELGYHGFFFYKDELVSVEELPRLRSRIDAPFLNYVYRPDRGAARASAA